MSDDKLADSTDTDRIKEILYSCANFYSNRVNKFTLDGGDYEGVDEALAAINHWHEQQCLREFLEIVPDKLHIENSQLMRIARFNVGYNTAIEEFRAAINAKYNHSEESGIVDNQVVTLDDLLTTPEEIAALPVVASGLQRDFRKGHGWDVERAKRSKQYQIGYHAGWMAAKRKYGGTDEKTN